MCQSHEQMRAGEPVLERALCARVSVASALPPWCESPVGVVRGATVGPRGRTQRRWIHKRCMGPAPTQPQNPFCRHESDT